MPTDQVSASSLLGLGITLLMGMSLVVVPRRLALYPIASVTCFMTFGQPIVIAGMNFTMLRLIVLFGCLRLFIRGEFRSVRWLRMDTIVVLWAFVSVAAYSLLRQSSGALVNALGVAYTALGIYFVCRALVRNLDDVRQAAVLFALLMVPLTLCMSFEKITGRNLFYPLGGVPEYSLVRNGVVRCQGPFAHSILAGTFGAAWMPIFVGLWLQGARYRAAATMGFVCSTVIMILSGSSGPVGTYIAGVTALMLWPLRYSMRAVRWSILGVLIGLHLVMKAPVWFIFARISFFSGSTGWHRSNLIDSAIANLSDWWLAGTVAPWKWGVWVGDITNQYILEGIRGGLLAMMLFIFVIVSAFSRLGIAMRVAKFQSRRDHLLFWAIGSALFAHVVTFLSVAYFDQNIVNWYLVIAMAATASGYARAHAAAASPVFRDRVPKKEASDFPPFIHEQPIRS